MSFSWKSLLTEARRLTKNNGPNAYRCAEICKALLADKAFMDEECGGKPDDADARLDDIADRFNFSSHELIKMLEHVPDAADWQTGKLRSLYNRMCRDVEAAQRRANMERAQQPREESGQQPASTAAPNGTKPSTQATVSVSAHERTAPLPVTKGEPKDYTEAVEVIERLREQGQHLQCNSVPRERYESLRSRYADLEAKYKALQLDHARLKATVAKMKRNLQAV